MRVLVTGGTGFLGSAVVRALLRRGHEPVVFARRASAGNLPVPCIDGDVRDRAALGAAVARVDAVCHTAALVSVWRPRSAEFDEVNVDALRTLIEICRERRTSRLVYTSSFLAIPQGGGREAAAGNDYQRTKIAALRMVRAAAAEGAPIVSLVPGVIYGPGPGTAGNLVGRLVRDHLAGRLPGIVAADRTWSFAYVDDVADAHAIAVKRGEPGREYTVGGENAPQMRLFEILREQTGVRLPRRIPLAVAKTLAALELTAARLTGRTPSLTPGTLDILAREWPLDSARSLAELSYRITPLETGVRETVAAIL